MNIIINKMAKAIKKKKDENLIPIEKMITTEEMNGLIAVVRSRQEFFQRMASEKTIARERSNSLLEERLNGTANKEAKDKIMLLGEKLMAEADKVYMKQYKEELSHQSGMVEFLHRFTNDKFTDLTGFFSL